MLKRIVACQWALARRGLSTAASSSAVDSLVLRSLKDHYFEVSKMSPPPKINPPTPYTIVKGALDNDGPVLRRTYEQEEIRISVMRLANLVPEDAQEEAGGDDISQLFLHVDIEKPGNDEVLHFLCSLYPDAMGIQAVSIRKKEKVPTAQAVCIPSCYQGPSFQDLDENLRDVFHNYIEKRGVNESLFSFLQSWLYVKDHRRLMRWFKTVGTFINKRSTS
ncbi:uncharacterized protein At2g39795, mitochondrial [Nymphaea colorata]|nr:uncharacterized protein At2g39795, mitochondrial [Nymphaea colorata]